MVVLAASFLIRSTGITIVDRSAPVSLHVILQSSGIGEFTSVITGQKREETHENIRTQFQVKPFENIDDGL